MNPIDQNLVDQFLAAWNAGRPPNNPLWIETQGTYALMKMDINSDGSPPVFQNNSGFPLKVFKNTETQELRSFDARRFAKR